MISMVRPGEGGIYDNAKVFMVGCYRDRVTGIIGKAEDGHWICGRGKRRSSVLVTFGLRYQVLIQCTMSLIQV